MDEMLPIVDAHVHLWNPEQFNMPWLAGHSQVKSALWLAGLPRADTGSPYQSDGLYRGGG